MVTEKDLVSRFFSWPGPSKGVAIGIGDDAAVLEFSGQTAVTCDTLVAGTHFLSNTDPVLLGRKCLAVNLSDLAAMGATPRHALLALTMPRADERWLQGFASGFRELAEQFEVALVGGDISRGPLSIAVTAIGECAKQPLRQSGARQEDDLWLSGTFGAADVLLREGAAAKRGSPLHDPTPRVELGRQLAGVASAAVDLSDGLCASCLLLARASGVRLQLNGETLPLDDSCASKRSLDSLMNAACGGEDYELLFCAPRRSRDMVSKLSTQELPLTRIGEVVAGDGAIVTLANEQADMGEWEARSYQHFSKQDAKGLDRAQAKAHAIGERLTASGKSLAAAESCTGGLLSAAMTSVAGASNWFDRGFVTYTAAAKREQLDVAQGMIADEGVVSKAVALAMAQGAMDKANASFGIGITGWAGPDAPDDGQPVGTVCIACARSGGQAIVDKLLFSGDRDGIRQQAVVAALDMLGECLHE